MKSSKRDDIIRATVELVAEKGFHNAPTIKIAERAGVAELTIFRNFKTKEGLIEATFGVLLADIAHYSVEGHDLSWPLKQQFFNLFRRFCSYIREFPERMIFVEQYFHSPEGWSKRSDLWHEQDANFERFPLTFLLVTGKKSGELKNLPTPVLYGIVVGALFNLGWEERLKGIKHRKEVQDDVLEAIWDGIAK